MQTTDRALFLAKCAAANRYAAAILDRDKHGPSRRNSLRLAELRRQYLDACSAANEPPT